MYKFYSLFLIYSISLSYEYNLWPSLSMILNMELMQYYLDEDEDSTIEYDFVINEYADLSHNQ